MANETPYTLGDYVGVIKRRWIWVATLLPGAILLAVYIAYTIPPLYRASGTILLEPSSIPEDMIRTTVTTYADQRIEIVQRRVMTIDNLEQSLVAEYDPYPNQPGLSDRDKARMISQNTSIERVDPVTLEPLLESNAFSMHYENPDPVIAAEVANRLVDMFLEYNQQARTERASDAHQFLLTQSAQVRTRIRSLESQLADFKTEYGEALPETQARNQEQLDRTQRDLDALESQLRIARERESLLQVQLESTPPNLFATAGDWRTELAQVRADLAAARQRYTEEHPTVRQLVRRMEELNARAGAAPDSGPAVQANNPDYLSIQRQLETVQQEIGSLEAQANRARQQIEQYERSLDMTPEVEREYRELMREYETAQERYAAIEADLREADLAQTLESEQRGERFALIRAPYAPSEPYSPNRLGIMLLGVVLGGGLAVGAAAITETSDPTIRSARDLGEITDIKPIAAVPVILNAADRRRRVLSWSAASLAFVAAAGFVGTVVA